MRVSIERTGVAALVAATILSIAWPAMHALLGVVGVIATSTERR